MPSNCGKISKRATVLYVPQVFTDVSSKRVLVMEKVEGIRIDEYARLDREGYDRKDLALKGGAAFFKMVLQDGLFHADPHPGNIFVLPDGRLGLVDFGIMGRVTEENMEYFASIFLALASHDYDALVRLYVDMGFLSEETTDIEKFQREMKEDLVELLEPYYVMQVKQIDFGAYVDRVTQILIRHHMRLPSNLYLMDKALITLEGILKQLDPEFNYFEAAKPYVAELVRRRRNPLQAAQNVKKNVTDFVDAFALLPKQVKMAFRKIMHGDIPDESSPRGARPPDQGHRQIEQPSRFQRYHRGNHRGVFHHHPRGARPHAFRLACVRPDRVCYCSAAGLWILIGILRSGQL